MPAAMERPGGLDTELERPLQEFLQTLKLEPGLRQEFSCIS